MDLTHRFTVPTSIDDAWAAFNDLERIAPCFPGAALTSYDGEEFQGLVKVKLGPISLQYTGTGRFVERDEATHRAVIEAKGRDKRGNGTAAAHVTTELSAAGVEATEVTVVTDLNVTGKPAQFGRGVMQDVSDKLLAQFAGCLETKLSGPDADPAAADSTPAADAGAADDAAPAAAADDAAPAAAADDAAPAAAADDAAPAAAAPPTGARAASPSRAAAAGPESTSAAALDLGATVLPVLLKRYAWHVVGLVVVVVVLRKLWSRRGD